MKVAKSLSLLSLVASVLAQSPVLVFNDLDNLVSCQSQPITWLYAGPDAPLDLTITNVGVDQNPSTTSPPTNTRTNGLSGRWNDQQRRDAITLQIASSLLPSAGHFVWPTVIVPQGYYQIFATLQDPVYTSGSAVFYVSQGPDTSCLGSTTTTVESSTAITTPPPTSTQDPTSSSTSPTSSASPTSSPVPVGGSSSTNVGAIAGGAIAGVVVLAIVALLYFFFVCRPRRNRHRALARQVSGSGPGSPRAREFGHTAQGRYGGLTSFDSHTMMDSRDAGRNIHAGVLGSSTAGVAAAATAGLRGLDPPSAAGRPSRDRADREKQTPQNSPYSGLTTNVNSAPTRRHHDSQAESLATTIVGLGIGDDKEDLDNGNSNILTLSDRSISRSHSTGSRTRGHNYSPTEEKYNDPNGTEMDILPSLTYESADTRRRPSVSKSSGPKPTSTSISSPVVGAATKKSNRKPVPVYDATLDSDTTSTTHITPTTPVLENPFEPRNGTGGHYAKRQAGANKPSRKVDADVSGSGENEQHTWTSDDPRQIALHGQQAHELQHKSSFGLDGRSGPVYQLMPDILPSQGK